MKRQVQSEPESGRPGLNRRLSAWEAVKPSILELSDSGQIEPLGSRKGEIREGVPQHSPTTKLRIGVAIIVCALIVGSFFLKPTPQVVQHPPFTGKPRPGFYTPEWKNHKASANAGETAAPRH